MQTPVIVFDHVRKNVVAVPPGPAADKKLAELIASQGKQVATGGMPKH
jgi:hypothetical protein